MKYLQKWVFKVRTNLKFKFWKVLISAIFDNYLYQNKMQIFSILTLKVSMTLTYYLSDTVILNGVLSMIPVPVLMETL